MSTKKYINSVGNVVIFVEILLFQNRNTQLYGMLKVKILPISALEPNSKCEVQKQYEIFVSNN